ncbi:ABC transporter ATP-binding protein [Gellertiella hungarica]|uniref:Oligopeptide transport system ATP-binding protein n=1 Tax=Gellertiella hungarica TaxID=1572859 RepID=A0A7W6NIY7_9HYPH|nr:oligopeptide/dipeptide ABC transporter ATP-binding protein [Gellertiella hungarica]MBB4062860.1 oligopeptide transport system ATP-binding protein [Gellertiella hungarica]
MSAEPILSVSGLSVRFSKPRPLAHQLLGHPRQEVRALNGIDLAVARGETLGIVGESGCGKSTLARCLAGLVTPTEGEIRFRGERLADLRGKDRRAYNRRVQLIFQDPYSSLNPRMTVGDMLSEALTVHRMRSGSGVDERIGELFELVRLPQDARDKYPHEFSGGQRQRIAIARALAVEPECLIADELVSALDVSVQAQVVNLMLDLQDRLGLTVLFVAHDLRLVRHVSHRVAVIYLGSVVEIGPSETVFSAPRHPYSQALLAAAPTLEVKEGRKTPALSGELPSPLAIPPGCPFHIRCPYAAERCRREKPALLPHGGGLAACHFAEEIAAGTQPVRKAEPQPA